MSDITAPQPQTGKIPETGNPMNLTCTTKTTTEDASPTILIVLAAPGATPPPPPPNSTTLVAPNSNVQYVIAGTGPDGNTIPGGGITIPGGGIAVYSIP